MTTGNGGGHRQCYSHDIVSSKVLGALSVPLVVTYPLAKRWTHLVSVFCSPKHVAREH